MKNTFCLIGIALSALIVGTISCNKPDDSKGTQVCRLTHVKNTDNTGNSYAQSIIYTGSQISKVIDSSFNHPSDTSLYTYNGNTITVSPGFYPGSASVYLGQAGRVDSIMENGTTDMERFTYDGQGILTSSIRSAITTSFRFTNGDLAQMTPSSGTPVVYQYDTTKLATVADPLTFLYLLRYGVHVFRNKHQVISTTSGGPTYTYQYQYDNLGNVTRVTKYLGTSVDFTYDFGYTCN